MIFTSDTFGVRSAFVFIQFAAMDRTANEHAEIKPLLLGTFHHLHQHPPRLRLAIIIRSSRNGLRKTMSYYFLLFSWVGRKTVIMKGQIISTNGYRKNI